MDHIPENIEDRNPDKEAKVLIVFFDMIANILNNNRLNPIVTGLFIRGQKRNISFFFIT